MEEAFDSAGGSERASGSEVSPGFFSRPVHRPPMLGARRWPRHRSLLALGLGLLGVLVILGVSLAAGIVERQQGCPPDDQWCYGPEGSYLTVFDAPLASQGTQALSAAGLSLALFAAASLLDARELAILPLPDRVGLCLAAYPVFFLLIVRIAPTVYVYG